MRGQDFLDRLRETVLVGDGAFGTLLSERGVGSDTAFERLNLSAPDLVRELHASYVDAGAHLIESNTFNANATRLKRPGSGEIAEINAAGVRIARLAAGTRAFVAGAVGPLARSPEVGCEFPLDDDGIRAIFQEQIVALADAGADLLLLETFSDLRHLLLAVEVSRKHTGLPIVAQMAFHEHGHTSCGVHVSTALKALIDAGVDVVGSNCGRGVRCVASAASHMTTHSDIPVSAFPNAGLPTFSEGRYLYGAPLPYMVDSAMQMVKSGVNLIGGCCGTTPEYVRRLAESLKEFRPAVRVRATVEATIAVRTAEPVVPEHLDKRLPADSIVHRVHEARRPDAPPRRPMIVVELDPPRGLNFEPILARARQFRDMGVDAITMADNPVATLHMGNLSFADVVQRELDLPVILHMACRDSNLLGLQSKLLEAHLRGVTHVLALTGDPAKVGDNPGATSVYDINSFGLIDMITRFNNGVCHSGQPIGGRTKFSIGVAFNPNGRNIAPLVDRLKRKAAQGAHYALTQPMYDLKRFDEIMPAIAPIGIPVFVGLMPLLSERNAEFLHNEVPGIVLTDEARARMKGLSGKEGRKAGNQLCFDLIDHMHPQTEAYYLIPPQKFTEMAVELISHIQSKAPVARG